MNETVYIDNNGYYHHIVKLTQTNIEYYNTLIHNFLYTSILINGWLENENTYHYVTKIRSLR
jgi:hypothetical protein